MKFRKVNARGREMTISERILKVLKERNMTQAEFAKQVGIASSTISEIVQALDTLLWPLLIVVAACGTIYSVVLGVNMARADSTEKREEAKKRLINVLVGIAITIGLILFFILVHSTYRPS